MSLAEQAGEDAEALLRQLMTIYDVKTLVAELVSVGEQHWSAAILKRVAALGRAAERLRPQEVAHLATLLPSPSAQNIRFFSSRCLAASITSATTAEAVGSLPAPRP